METINSNVKVLPLPSVTTADHSNFFIHEKTDLGAPPKAVVASYPDTILNVRLDEHAKRELIKGESTWIDPAFQKENEMHELHVDRSNEIILTKYLLVEEKQPASREMRNITTNEVSFDKPIRLEQQQVKRQLMPWESSTGDSDQERKNGISR